MSPLNRRSVLVLGTAAALPGLGSGTAPTRYVAELVTALHRDCQAAKYREVGRALPRVGEAVERLVTDRRNRQTLALRCGVLIAQAKLATKLGDGVTAYAAAEEALRTAETTDDPIGRARAAYWLTCALLKLADPEEAERNAVAAAEVVTGLDPRSLSCRGSLVLIGSVIAARRGDAAEARRRLAHAARLADRLGRDGNIGFSAFGPTNVAIHRMSVAAALGDPDAVLSSGERLDVDSMPPGLLGRRGQYHLESAWAHSRRGEPVSAVVHLLEAERVAPELVRAERTNRTARALVEDLLAQRHPRAVPGLRGLACRTGLLA
ncbi:hypothetical protein JOF41_003845 [Saccharothrix coeruleofusca]|uniref:XRE family transcriptional regulator n=1 Tax=Saccharothrix coeruleofusca TaxID=33919 RepID=UPI001AE3605E|nr:XRE family transcriptional regulator [Saccharothrix coeruleofusca]MBP2337667.1 hypothetical protein [Saccharothrix coeruleofusca]